MSVRRLREATLASPRFQVDLKHVPPPQTADNEHEYLRKHVDPVLMPLIEALLLFQPESIYDFIRDYVDEHKAARFARNGGAASRTGGGYAKKLTTRRTMVDFMSSSVIPVMDDLARQILREKPNSVKGFIKDVVAARIVLGTSDTDSNQIDGVRYCLNDSVLCRYKGRPRYFKGIVTAVDNRDGVETFTIQYDDGKVETHVHPVCLKPCPSGDTGADSPAKASSQTAAPNNQEQSGPIDIVILIIGIDGAGKTTLLSTLQGDLDKEHVPSAGFTSASFQLDTGAVTFYDLGGGPAFRNVWTEYYADVHGVIFVVDSSSEKEIAEAAPVLQNAMAHATMANKPLLLFANKRDQPTAVDEPRLAEMLQLDRYSTSKCMPCVAKPAANGSLVDDRLEQGLSWLFDQVKAEFPSLGARVKRDVALKHVEDQRRRDEQRARVSKWKEERERLQMTQQDKPSHRVTEEASTENQVAQSSSTTGSKQAETPEEDAVIRCSNCSTEPAVTKCAASKWMPVCAACATALKANQ